MARDLGVDLASWRGKSALVRKGEREEPVADVSGSYSGSPDFISLVYTCNLSIAVIGRHKHLDHKGY